MVTLKTKITTSHLESMRDFYVAIFGMEILQEWNEPDDKGVILAIRGGDREALLEIAHGAQPGDFSALSLQFKVDDVIVYQGGW
ncbi:MAG: VOC family protein [Bryobacterales bacterium]